MSLLNKMKKKVDISPDNRFIVEMLTGDMRKLIRFVETLDKLTLRHSGGCLCKLCESIRALDKDVPSRDVEALEAWERR